MTELIEHLKSRVGLDDDKARVAAQAALEFLKQRLPEPISSQLETYLTPDNVQGLAGKIGDVFGKKTA